MPPADVRLQIEGRGGGRLHFPRNNPAPRYLRDNFEASDRVAVVLINRKSGAVIQRLTPVEKLAADDAQRWLRQMNEKGFEVYVSMNALKGTARGRTKYDIGMIRHVYLDLDHDG